jgi:hypothetical protein
MKNVFKVATLFMIFSVNNLAFAEEYPLPNKNKTAILVGIGRNYPVAQSKLLYSPSLYHPIVGFRHLSEHWILGVSIQFKFLENKVDETKVVLWALEEEFNYKIRLYHPLYFLIGGKTLYLYPVQKAQYPFHRRTDLAPEIGVAATSSLLFLLPQGSALGIFADIWRGTASRKFQAWEAGMYVMFPLPF